MEDNRDHEKVTNGDIEFALFLAESEDDKDKYGAFIVPLYIYKVYVETTTKDDTDDEFNEVAYNVYISIDGMYYLKGKFDDKKSATLFANNTCISLEKMLKNKLTEVIRFGIHGDIDEQDRQKDDEAA